jgi:D-xylose transport system substrate-binding protein
LEKHIQKITRILVFFFLIIQLAACDVEQDTNKKEDTSPNLSTESNTESAPNDNLKIGFSMDTLEEERWLKDKELFTKELEALGVEVEIMIADEDAALQIAQVETMISNGVDLLVVVPYYTETAAAIVEKAHSAGVKVVSYDRIITNANVDLYISFDNEMVGEIQAKSITNLVPKGNYVYIGGSVTDNNAILLKKGVFNVLQPFIDRGDIKVVYDQWTEDWTPDNAYKNMLEALEKNNNQIDAVIAGNDGTAGIIPVAGQDADLAAIQRIVQGTQTMTAYKPIRELAKRAAELSVELAKGETIEVDRKINNGKIEVPSVLLSPVEVTINNIEDTIIADEFHSSEEVYGN